MIDETKPKIDFFSLVRKETKKNIPPKREVIQRDFLLVKKNVKTSLQQLKTKTEQKVKELIYDTMPTLSPRSKGYLAFFFFVSILLLITLGFQSVGYLRDAKESSGKILGVATSAYGDLDSASKNLESQNFSDASKLFESAKNNLSGAVAELDRFRILTFLVPSARSADHVLDGAYDLAQGGEKLTNALAVYNELMVSSQGVENSDFSQTLKNSRDKLQESLNFFNSANEHFEKANSLPEEYKGSVEQAKNQVTLLSGILTKLLSLEDLYLALFGSGDKTYLLIFQNHDELRATGGFIGTYGVIKINDGKISNLKIESIYSLDGTIYDQVAAPGPFQPEIKKWGTRDANWFADFPTSANKILSFFEKGRETADGVLAFTPSTFEDIVGMVGPVEMPDYDVTLTRENFQEVVQQKTSVDYDKELNQPKKFLADFAPVVMDKLKGMDKDGWLQIMQLINTNMRSKSIMLYSRDQVAQDQIVELGYAGQILEAPHDYLAVINSNLGGTKTDLEIQQNIQLETTVLSDGTIQNSLVIERFNGANEQNKNFARILVPLGSKLVSTDGFDKIPQFSSAGEDYKTDEDLLAWDKAELYNDSLAIRTESGKTEFSGWMVTSGVTTKTVKIIYTLPFKLDFSALSNAAQYSLLFQRQAGANKSTISGSWSFKNNLIWKSENLEAKGQELLFSTPGQRDEYWSVLLSE